MEITELPKEVKSKLGEVIELWAENVLNGKPKILGIAVFSSLEKMLIDKTNEINKLFE